MAADVQASQSLGGGCDRVEHGLSNARTEGSRSVQSEKLAKAGVSSVRVGPVLRHRQGPGVPGSELKPVCRSRVEAEECHLGQAGCAQGSFRNRHQLL